MNFEAFINDIQTNHWKVHGAEIYKDQKLVHNWGDTQEIHPIYSCTKTILALAAGIAWDRGLFDFDKSVLEYLPEVELNQMSAAQKEDFSKITIHRLMTMSLAGLPFRAQGDRPLTFSLAQKIKNPETPSFNYSNICAFLTSVALTKVVGDVGSFIEKEIFAPLEITDYKMGYTPDGYFSGASNIELSVHSLSKIGLLLYNKGKWQDTQIISETFVEKATSVLQMNREGGYGYFIWKYRDGFCINGKWKQKCYILPKQGLIISYLSDIPEEKCALKESMEKWILE